MTRKTTHTDMATYGPGIFTPEELEEAPEGSIFIGEEMDAYVKAGGAEWVVLEEPRGDGEPGEYPMCVSAVAADEQMGVLVVKEKRDRP